MVRTGLKFLTPASIGLYPAAMNIDKTAANLHLYVRNDGGRTRLIVVRGLGADKDANEWPALGPVH